jgi:hypothetical protein
VLQITEARRANPLTSRAEVYLRIRKSHPKPWCSRNKTNCVCIMYNFGLLLLKLSNTPPPSTSSASCSYSVHDLPAVQSGCSSTRLSGDDGEVADVYIHSIVKEDGMRVSKTAFTSCAPRSTPLQPSSRLNRPLPMTSRRDYPLTSPSRALGPLVIVTSLIGSTAAK